MSADTFKERNNINSLHTKYIHQKFGGGHGPRGPPGYATVGQLLILESRGGKRSRYQLCAVDADNSKDEVNILFSQEKNSAETKIKDYVSSTT